MHQIQNVYREKVALYEEQYHKLNRIYNIIAYLRLVVFVLGVIAVYLIYPYQIYGGIVTGIVFLIFFFFLIKRHDLLAEKRQLLRYLRHINESELRALTGNFKDFDGGQEYVDSRHDYTHDLDIFGNYSIFQFINRTTTLPGKHHLALALNNPLQQGEDIRRRQHAARSLVPEIDWTQNFQAQGMSHEETQADLDRLFIWAQKPEYDVKKTWWNIILWVLPGLLILTILAWLLQFILVFEWVFPGQIPVLLFLVNLGITGRWVKHTNGVHAQVGKQSGLLTKYSSIFSHIDTLKTEDTFLQALQNRLIQKEHTASGGINQLKGISEQFDQRLNMIVAILLNGLILWDIRTVKRLEVWKMKYGASVPGWFEVTGQFDMLISLSRLALNHPEYCWPHIQETGVLVEGEKLGHPLIDPNERVDNPLKLNREGMFWLITGANMAGKSTYLRAVGVNLVLAMAGAPVCATSFRIKPMPLITSMRTTDSLASHTSYFLAELNILKKIIDKLGLQAPVFVMIDEMLRGTNSRDKQTGSQKFIEQLIRKHGIGLVATHDLSLGTLADDYPGQVVNKCFEITIAEDQLTFDYKLRDGISQNLNATFLMEKMGLMG